MKATKAYQDLEGARRRTAQQMREGLDEYAQRKGYVTFLDLPANVLDVNEADLLIGGGLKFCLLYPLEWAKKFISRHPGTPQAQELAAMMNGQQHERRKLERSSRRHVQRMLSVWQQEFLPALTEAQAYVRRELEDGAETPTIRRLAEDGRIRMPSSFFTYELGRAIAQRNFKAPEAPASTSPWPVAVLKDGHAELRPAEAARNAWLEWPAETLAGALENMNRRLETFGPRTRDIYAIMLARWMQHQSSGKSGHPWIGVDEILELLGYAKKLNGGRYGFPDDSRWMVREAIESLAHIDVTMNVKVKSGKRKVQQAYTGRFLMLGDRRGQAELGGSDVGAFTHIEFSLPALASQGVGPESIPYLYLHIKALQYPEKRKMEKNFAFYIAEMARINVGDRLRAKVGKLLAEAGKQDIDVRKAAEVRRQLEVALDRLAADNIIEDWKYDNAEWNSSAAKARAEGKRPRGWQDKWLEQAVEFMLPQEYAYDSILTHRQARIAHQQERKAPPAETFTLKHDSAKTLAGELAAAIDRRGISKADAAAEIGISRPTLNALLDGKATRATVRQRAGAWLQGR